VWLPAVLAAFYFAGSAQALDPNRVMSQYRIDRWGSEQGFAGGPVYGITQSADGYLWIGAENGLFRFDGLRFVSVQRANSAGAGPVLGVLADGEGNLWVRFEHPSLVRYRDGMFQNAFSDENLTEPRITAMCPSSDGRPLFSGHITDAMKYSRGRFEELSYAAKAPSALVISMAETPGGEVWMGTRDSGLVSMSKDRIATVSQGLPNRKINCILPTGKKELWIGTDNGVVAWNGTELTKAGIPDALTHVQVLALLKDRESNIWAGTARGLYRVNTRGVLIPEKNEAPNAAVNALFEDREGNLWVGGTQGVERFRDNAFLTYSRSSGLPSGHSSDEAAVDASGDNGPLYVDAEGRTWFAPSEGGLYWIKDAHVEAVRDAGLSTDVIYSIAGGPGEVWVGRQRGGMTRLRYRGASVAADTYARANGLAQNSVYAIYRSRDGAVWAGTLSGGVSRFRNGHFVTYTTANGVASNTVAAIEQGNDGTIYIATPNGLSAFSNERWRSYTVRDGLPPGSVNCLHEDSGGALWIGTDTGIAFLQSGRVQVPREMPEHLYEGIVGISEDRSNWLWIATSHHLLRVKRDALMNRKAAEDDVREYGTADGLPGTQAMKRDRSVVTDSLGRVWFSLNRGISTVDPARLARNSAPALVHLQTVSADGRAISMQGPLRIRAAHRITFSYAGVSLSAPERMKFRYALDPFDHGWSDAQSGRDAVYTNLSPGSYVFRVMANNADGLWNGEQAVIGLDIEPAYWQTWWFRAACVAAFLLIALAFFRYRMHHMANQLTLRFEERLAERTRIAQELHDTLLQGVLSVSMQLHVATERVPADSAARPPLNRVLQLMGQVIEEGRNAVRGLRSDASGSVSLEDALSRVRQAINAPPETEFRVIIEGQPRPLHPVVRDEAYRIGREALVNAFRHSNAKSIELEVEYAAHHLRLLVRDNGCGIDPAVLKAGRDGHWGLSGIRERADRIGARLSFWSSATAGTEMELSVPSHVAFQSDTSKSGGGWIGRLFPGKAGSAEKTGSGRLNG
jgi:signal transduction histidine kinase/ligand-binding sensor domain-containing protein